MSLSLRRSLRLSRSPNPNQTDIAPPESASDRLKSLSGRIATALLSLAVASSRPRFFVHRFMGISGLTGQPEQQGQQGQEFSQSAVPSTAPSTASSTVPPPPPADASRPNRLQVWEHRIFVASLVLCASVFGVLLVALPWTSLWSANAFFMRHPQWLDAVNHPFLRGAVSGLGLLDLWIAFSEALGYRDPVPSNAATAL